MADKLRFEDIIGVIFDINGTMFFDSEKHIRAWNQYVHELTGVELSPKGIQRYIINKSPKEILEHFLGGELSAETIEQLSDEKESIYRQLCRADEKNLRLAPGLEKFLDFLAENNVPRTIATTASASNEMFYF